jgi:hypothetical protein
VLVIRGPPLGRCHAAQRLFLKNLTGKGFKHDQNQKAM